MRDGHPQAVLLSEYCPPDFFIDSVDLEVSLFDDFAQVRSCLSLRANPQGRKDAALVLDGQGQELLSLSLDGRELSPEEYRLDEDHLAIEGLAERAQLVVVSRCKPQENTALEGLYMSDGMYCTQCEAEGFRKLTYFLDRPDVMARFSTRIEADKARFPVLLSNGNCVESGDLTDGRHFARWVDPFPKPCYLFALVAGDLRFIEDRFVTMSGREVVLRIFVEPENIDRCDFAMASLKAAMAWDEREYGREYDLDIYMIVAVNSFNMGAMENKGLNIFNSKYVLADPASATDRDFQGVEGVIAHEYFHNWTGNRITCRDWFQLSLKEGLTVFRDQEFSADQGSRGVKRIDDVRVLRSFQFPEDAGPMAHPVRPDSYIEINNFYTVTVYNKGAEVVRMQRLLLGAAGYRKATDLYFERHDGQAVTCDDFVQCMADASGRDLSVFKRWYSQAGTPLVKVQGFYDADAQRLTLHCQQSCAPTPGQEQKLPFHIPLAVGLIGPDGVDLPLVMDGQVLDERTVVLELCESAAEFVFEQVPEGCLPSLLRGFSAPVKLEFDYSPQDLAFLMAHDSDDFNRWDAAQNLAVKVILALARQDSDAQDLLSGYVEAFGRALAHEEANEEADADLIAQVLSLPGVAYLGELVERIDVLALYQAREALRLALAQALEPALLARWQGLRALSGGAFEVTPEAIGRRSLANTLLWYLSAQRDQATLARLLEQFESANTMSDSLAALGLLAERSEEGAVEAFYQRWQSDVLVLDKWFSAQAMADRDDALERVQGLMKHPAFSMSNPNKVRALIGGFAANSRAFHALDGSGYRFLADRILELDRINPQVAARMTNPFTRWRRYVPAHGEAMRAQLERIAATEGLSADVYELASKSLA